ncbi:FAD-dependent oxidoreductase [Paracoccus sp. R12_1]|uniref:NAD(P)/FAD-dependent oxidoreductase n=1 Tax=unclassified Paracoccus (in: a-proteobacteria) TaxID=2688777 RepID=UPI001ADB4A6D|nr:MULTISPECIES: FAD-binding oxidoreductase [unclassified Paracoccus (in: a-proteobacteria)]MBO9457137.1 FAD-dependent oxidoreductase [Paracoccus sp. R12_2]MBO9488434.1 FAD-dependent oxidoreductase [Paracoccus sp. R12_1]
MDVMAKRAGSVPFDPFYDPMTAPKLGPGSDYAPTYWIGTAGEIPDDDGPVTGDMDVDVAVIGSGYTGLSCAIHLAKMHGIKATVLEANGVAYGCSTRNGGQAQISSGRLKRSQWIARWGLDAARALHDEVVEAFDLFRGLIRDHGIDCQPQDGGHYYIAHKASAMPALESETRLLNETFGYGARMLDRDELFRTVARDHEAHGAMWEPDGVGIHAARLAFGYLRVARELGATVHPDSPVQGWVLKDGIHHLRTPGGTVRARRVAVATAAYAPRALHPRLKDRLMPIMSNSVVTRVLTADELDAVGIRKLSPLTDTRTLRHYYRLLPDNRLQIGSRAAITGRDAANPAHLKALREGMARKFPVLRGIDLDYSWWGWVDVSHDMMPRITGLPDLPGAFYALGYGGNGVMYSAMAGRRMAQLVAGETVPDLPIFNTELPHEGWKTPFRRLGQWGLYHLYHFRDERK